MDYIRNTRLEQARLMLETTQRSVSQISELFCFGTPNYFSTVFARRYGRSPAQYRAHHTASGEKEKQNETENQC